VGCDLSQRAKLTETGRARGGWDSGTDSGLPWNDDSGVPDEVDSGEPEEEERDTGEEAPSDLADTGPELDPRLPRSLLSGDDAELDVTLTLLSGVLPTDISGHMFLVHPVPQGGGAPILLGDGRMVRFDFSPGGVQCVSRMARTPCHYADQATLGTAEAFQDMGLARTSMVLGNRNMANTGWLVMGDRMLLTYDGGRPWEIDTQTLELATAVGRNDEWPLGLPDFLDAFINWPFPLHMTTAHPAHDPDTDELFTVAYGFSMGGIGGFVDLIRWDGAGDLERFRLTNDWGWPVEIVQSVHQIAVTRSWVVIMDTAFLQEMEQLWDESATRAQSPDTVVWLVRRSDLRAGAGSVVARSVTIPREAAHFIVDHDDTGDLIRLICSHNCAADPSEFLRATDTRSDTGAAVDPGLVGMLSAPTDLGALGRYVIHAPTASILDSALLFDEDHTWGGPQLYTHAGAEAPGAHDHLWWISLGYAPETRISRMDALYGSYRYRRVSLADLPSAPLPARLFRVDAGTLEIRDTYAFPPGRVCLSPQHLPREGATDDLDGYIVVTVISDDTSTSGSTGDEVWIFDAADLAQGPLARLGHPSLRLPFTLHTAWMPAIAPRTAAYQVDVEADHEEAVSLLSSDLQAMFTREVYPHFA
jgi:carotenoid cleavage dioxygenase-like enzyme